MNEYKIGIGIDSGEVVGPLESAIETMKKTQSTAETTSKAIEDSFKESAKEVDNFGKKLKPIEENLDGVKKASKDALANFKKELDLKDAANSFKKEIDNLKSKISEIDEKKKVGFEIDSKTISDLENASNYLKENYEEIKSTLSRSTDVLNSDINETKTLLNELNSEYKSLEESISNMAPGRAQAQEIGNLKELSSEIDIVKGDLKGYEDQLSEINRANKELDDTLKNSENAFKGLNTSLVTVNSSFDEVYGDVQPLTTRLGELEDRMYELALAGKRNTQEFAELQQEAIRYRQTIQQVDAAVDTFAKSSGKLEVVLEAARGLAGGFAIVEGATALLGEENEELQETLLRVNAAMTILQGLQEISALLNKDSAISAMAMRNANVANTASIQASTVAIGANATATAGATIVSKAFGVALKSLGIGIIIALLVTLYENWNKVTETVNKFLPAGAKVEVIFDKIKSVAVGVGTAIINYIVAPFKALGKAIEGDWRGALAEIGKGFNIVENYKNGYKDQELKNEQNRENEKKQLDTKNALAELERRKRRGENVLAEEKKLQERLLTTYKKGSKEYEEQKKVVEGIEDDLIKYQRDKAKEAQKKREQDAKEAERKRKEAQKKAEADEKKRLEDQKKADDQVLELRRNLQDINLDLLEDGLEKEKKQIEEDFKRKIEDAKREENLSKEAKEIQGKIIEELKKQQDKKIEDLEKNHQAELLKIRLNASAEMVNLSKDSQERDLESLRIDHEKRKSEIEINYKDEAETREALLMALEESTERERQKIRLKWRENEIEEEEEREILLLELMQTYGKKTEKSEIQKQIAINEIQLKYQKEYLKNLLANGEEEDSLVVLRVKNTIQNLEKETSKLLKDSKGKGFDMFEFLGLGELDGEQREKVKQALEETVKYLGEITDFIVDQYDRQIEKKQESIDQLTDEIEDLEDRLNDEKALQEQGLANNVQTIEAELAQKKLQRDEEIKQQEELLEKKKQMQKVQLLMDSAMQISNLITASTSIFKSLADIPFVGVPLAIALIGTMFGAFAVTKVKALQAIEDSGNTTKYAKGGKIKGKKHSQGGEKFYSQDGKTVKELEHDEWVINSKSSNKYDGLLKAINNDDFGDKGLKKMLAEFGILMSPEIISNSNKSIGSLSVNVKTESNKNELREINNGINRLVKLQTKKTEITEDEDFTYYKKGSETIRVKKKKDEVQI